MPPPGMIPPGIFPGLVRPGMQQPPPGGTGVVPETASQGDDGDKDKPNDDSSTTDESNKDDATNKGTVDYLCIYYMYKLYCCVNSAFGEIKNTHVHEHLAQWQIFFLTASVFLSSSLLIS